MSDIKDKYASMQEPLLTLYKKQNTCLQEYINLLEIELSETISIADTHGWKSTKWQQGIEIRKILQEYQRMIDKYREN